MAIISSKIFITTTAQQNKNYFETFKQRINDKCIMDETYWPKLKYLGYQ